MTECPEGLKILGIREIEIPNLVTGQALVVRVLRGYRITRLVCGKTRCELDIQCPDDSVNETCMKLPDSCVVIFIDECGDLITI